MRVAIVGAGTAGLLHALSFRAHGVPVACVFDPDTGRARALAELCGARTAGCLDELARSDAPCVAICSPPPFHAAQAARCARPGRVTFVEKPVAISSGELAQMMDLVGCVPIVQWRAGRALRAIRAAIGAGRLGPSPTVSVDLALHRDAIYFDAGRGTREAWGCGALLSVGIHALDAVCFALGQHPVAVRCELDDAAAEAVERAALLVARFSGGAMASMRVTFDGGGPDETRLSFCGGGVTASIIGSETDPPAGPVQWKAHSGAAHEQLEELELQSPGSVAAPLLVPYLGAAVAALRRGLVPGQTESLLTLRDVAPAHLLALQAYASASIRKPCREVAIFPAS